MLRALSSLSAALLLLSACSAEGLAAIAAASSANPPQATPGSASAVTPNGTPPAASAQDPALKRTLTPSFYQLDSEAGFENGGENYCAPTSVSDGLIYLALARNMKDLVPGTDHTGQSDLIKQLADHMSTDPDQGTPPSGIIDGVQSYAASRNYAVRRLEVAGWRSVGSNNTQYKIATQPDLAWMRAAAQDPDTITLLSVGWYRAGADGYTRHSGHWVDVVGVGAGPTDFELRNPAIVQADQAQKTTVSLTALDSSFSRLDTNGAAHDMTGYFGIAGPGLPYGASTTAVVDGAMVFTLSK